MEKNNFKLLNEEGIFIKNLPKVNDETNSPFSFSFFGNFLFLINRLNSSIIIFDISKKEIVNTVFVENKFITSIHIDSLNGIVFLVSHKKIYSAVASSLISGDVGFSEITHSRCLESDEFFNGIIETIPEKKEIFFVVQVLRKFVTKIIHYHAAKDIRDIFADDEDSFCAKTTGYRCKYFTEIVPKVSDGTEISSLIRGLQYLPKEKKLMLFSFNEGNVYLMDPDGSILNTMPEVVPKNFWNFYVPSKEETLFVSMCFNNTKIQVMRYNWNSRQMELVDSIDFSTKINDKKHFPIAVGPEGNIFVFDLEKTFYVIERKTTDTCFFKAFIDDFAGTETVPPLLHFSDEKAENKAVVDGDSALQNLSSPAVNISDLINNRLKRRRSNKIVLTFSKINDKSKKTRKADFENSSSFSTDVASFFQFPEDSKPSSSSFLITEDQNILGDEDWTLKNPLFPKPENCEWKTRSDSLCQLFSPNDFFY